MKKNIGATEFCQLAISPISRRRLYQFTLPNLHLAYAVAIVYPYTTLFTFDFCRLTKWQVDKML